jgi:hypothetical protein
MKININTDYKSSPKKELVKELTTLFFSYEIDKVKTHFTEDIQWTLLGDEPVLGKEKFAAALKEMSGRKVAELTIDKIITHGNEAAVNGEIIMEDGERFGFSDFYGFTSGQTNKVTSITSYVVQL